MGVLSFFVKSDKAKFAIIKTKDEFEVDFLDSEGHEWSNTVTEYPVENGTSISDHLIENAKMFKISGIAGDSPINLFDVASGAFSEPKTQRAVTFFESLVSTKSLVSVSGKLKSYDNMACQDVKINRNRSSGNSIRYDISFKEVRIVDTAFSDTSTILGAAKTATGELKKTGVAAAPKDLGKQPNAAASPATEEKSASILASWAGIG